jgi:tRNA1Val (adenine37-N6)-methyltransferase
MIRAGSTSVYLDWDYLIGSDMSNSWFRFQKFIIYQERSAMKVGTDGVLLGSWASGGSRILDIGTGTGLVAVMMAQRFPLAQITALEVEEDAVVQANGNVADCPWADRMAIVGADFLDWTPPDGCVFDRIVCNPPYFTRSLSNPDSRRSMARHDEMLPLPLLIGRSAGLLAPGGGISLILPVSRVDEAIERAASTGLHLVRRLDVRGHAGAPVKRALVEWSQEPLPLAHGELVLEVARGVWSDHYRKLTADFYL